MQKEIDQRAQQLISEGVFLTGQLNGIKQRLHEVKTALEIYFPASKTEEILLCKVGSSKRRVQNSWELNQEQIGALEKLLGEKSNMYIRQDVIYKPTAALRALVKKSDTELAGKVRPFIEIDQSISITFQLPVAEVADENIS